MCIFILCILFRQVSITKLTVYFCFNNLLHIPANFTPGVVALGSRRIVEICFAIN